VDQEGNPGQFDPPVSDTPDETARIREQIEQTRAGDAVAQKVQTMVNTASDRATRVAEQARSSAESLSSQMQSHPLPSAVILGGLVWWLMRRRRSSYRNGEHEFRGERRAGATSLGDRARNLGDTANEYRQRAQAAVGGYADQAAEQARHVRDVTRTRMDETTSMLLERSKELEETVDRWMHENPLAVGVAVFALGAIAGLSIQATETEHRTLGVARDSLLQRAGRAVGSAMNPADPS
jgi:ElaB/YqjD/DUF883 family membrane-anchored ribosome-binding protein